MNDFSSPLIVFGIIVLLAIIVLCIRNYNKARARKETQTKAKLIDRICALLGLREEQVKETQAKAALVQFAQYTKQSSQSVREIFASQAPECITSVHQAMDNVVVKYFGSLDKCIETECEDLYLPAVKAALPREKWRKEFEAKLSEKVDNLIPRDKLNSDLKAAEVNAITDLTNLLHQTEPTQSSLEIEEGLAYLVNNPDKLNQLLDRSDPLREVMELQREIRGNMLAYVLQKKPWLKQISENMDFTFPILEALEFISDIIDVCSTVIRDWIVDLVGEEVLSEALEWVATVVIPIIGQIMLILKLAKYGDLARKLFITKESLQRLKGQLHNECERIIRETGEFAKNHVSEQVTKIKFETDNYLTTLERSCNNVIEANSQ